jgi:glycosyltransferase involved in cell wall biosynthesis
MKTNPEIAGSGRPKVVRIIGRLVGGPARQTCLLHQELTPEFQTLLIAGSPSPGEHDMAYLLRSEQDVVRLAEMSREVSWWDDARAFMRIVRLFRSERPQIVHTHTAKAGALGRLAAWVTGVPVVVHTYHGHVFHSYFGPVKTRVYLQLERLLGKITSRVIAISDSQKRELAERYKVVPASKISLVKNGFHLDAFSSRERREARQALGLNESDFVLVWAGRMAPVKDVDLLADVVRSGLQQCSRARFLVLGDGEDRARLEELVSGCDNVQILGWRRDMEQVWRAADAAILTSRNEGTPTALIEAMAAGLPFVATQVGGVSDLSNGNWRPLPEGMGFQAANGFLTIRTCSALLYCISRLIADPSLAQRMGNCGKAFVTERFSSPRLVGEISSLYKELLSMHGQPLQECSSKTTQASSNS